MATTTAAPATKDDVNKEISGIKKGSMQAISAAAVRLVGKKAKEDKKKKKTTTMTRTVTMTVTKNMNEA